MTVVDYLKFAGELRGMTSDAGQEADAARCSRSPTSPTSRPIDRHAVARLSASASVSRRRSSTSRSSSILDEPTRGLDPVQIVEMRNLIHDLKQNHTVLISSHILTEISQTCDRLLVLGKGKLLGAGSESELSAHEGDIRQITVTVRAPSRRRPEGADHARCSARSTASPRSAEPYEQGGGLTFSLSTNKDCRADVSRAIVEAKLDLLKLDYARSELENTFIRLVGGADASN